MAPAAGTILNDEFRLVSLLDRGGMGSVWRAVQLSTNAPVAIKLIAAEVSKSPQALARFKREARAAAAIRSPHVVQIIEFNGGEIPFIAMELLEGESLDARLIRYGSMPPGGVARVISHVGRAMIRAHEMNVIHRDLKPSNIFLVENEDEEIAKVLDFGIAKADHFQITGLVTQTGSVFGTPYYMSPEQLRGREVDHRTDLWSLGVIAYECMTGVVPFQASTVPELTRLICQEPIPVPSSRGPVPPGFDEWFAKAACRDLDARFQTARELVRQLQLVCCGAITLSDRVPANSTSRPPSSSSRSAPTVRAEEQALTLDGSLDQPAPNRPEALETAEKSAPKPLPAARKRRLPLPVAAGLALTGVGLGLFWGGNKPTPTGLDSGPAQVKQLGYPLQVASIEPPDPLPPTVNQRVVPDEPARISANAAVPQSSVQAVKAPGKNSAPAAALPLASPEPPKPNAENDPTLRRRLDRVRHLDGWEARPK
jgi:eukaryotic-like serine/threonine-protein kinase